MTYHTDNKVRKYVQGYGFLPFARSLGSKYGKQFKTVAKMFKTTATKNNQSKYGQLLKKEELKVGKLAGK